ncbi:hypothetical protein [Paraflavitalea pollutisoli]|uniref:hypothetical protein n=1 Tax=Paraflavitalea pollutisoli TaxID=3034143 RepID=UPI0023EAA29C|nr:hypothetical protein [Paraflavitalea sp. H1-2-19X]
MENNRNEESGLFNLAIEGEAKQLLHTAASWARIVAIIGFISAGITLLSTILSGAKAGGFALAGSLLFVTLFLVIGVVLNIFLYRFATNTLASLENMSQVQFNEGANNLKTYFKLMAILIIIAMALFFIVFLAFALGASMMGR